MLSCLFLPLNCSKYHRNGKHQILVSIRFSCTKINNIFYTNYMYLNINKVKLLSENTQNTMYNDEILLNTKIGFTRCLSVCL